jgi:hypothetical protein
MSFEAAPHARKTRKKSAVSSTGLLGGSMYPLGWVDLKRGTNMQ